MRETLIPTMEDSTAFYIKEIGNHDLLTAEKEVELAKIKDQEYHISHIKTSSSKISHFPLQDV